MQVLGGLPDDTPHAPDIPTVKGHKLLGGPQMIQLRYNTATLQHALQETFCADRLDVFQSLSCDHLTGCACLLADLACLLACWLILLACLLS